MGRRLTSAYTSTPSFLDNTTCLRTDGENDHSTAETGHSDQSYSQQRRKHIRITPQSSQPIRIDINGGNFIEILRATDISEGGVGIKVEHGFKGCAINNNVAFVIELPNKSKNVLISLQGKIRHLSGDRFGVSFSLIPESAKQAIRNYVASQLREQSLIAWIKYKTGFTR